MNKKSITVLGKMITLIVVALTVMIVSNRISVHAGNGDTVRVSTSKELKNAIKDANVGTIIFRTEAYIDITIKSAKGAKTKELIIDAENANITNKAVFESINIISANSYTESVSGNRISLRTNIFWEGLTVSKKKKVESLMLYSDGLYENCYTLRKGAKIGEVSLMYSDEGSTVLSEYNKSKRLLSIKCSKFSSQYTIKLDKSGRIISLACEFDDGRPEAYYDEVYTYDSNGNILKIIGKDILKGSFVKEKTYFGDLMIKESYKSDFDSDVSICEYDKDVRLVHKTFIGEYSSDGTVTKYYDIEDYEYDEKGRLLYEKYEEFEFDYSFENTYTYDSKGFLVELYYENIVGDTTTWKYKYDKAGNKIEVTEISGGKSHTYKYNYDEFGVLIY